METLYFALLLAFFSLTSAQFEGDDCVRTYDQSAGICKLASECPQVGKEYNENRTPITTCGYSKRQSIVCCPNGSAATPSPQVTQQYRPSSPRPSSNIDSSLRISARKCQDYSKLTRTTFYVNSLTANSDNSNRPISIAKCEFTNALVVGGTKTKPGEFPHMAALGWTEEDEINFKCGGSLISERYVLTAAHCAKSARVAPDIVRLGEQNLKKFNDGAQEIDYRIAEVIKHPNYKTRSNYDDIALIKLVQNVVFNQFVRPACLWQTDNINDTKAIAIGFGTTGYAEAQSDELLKVGLNIIDNRDCRNYIDEMNRLDKGIISTQLCAGVLDGGKDTCGGDSGGPLQITTPKNPCVYHLIGLTSFGSTYCGGKNAPGVYSRVSSYLDWIEPIVW